MYYTQFTCVAPACYWHVVPVMIMKSPFSLPTHTPPQSELPEKQFWDSCLATLIPGWALAVGGVNLAGLLSSGLGRDRGLHSFLCLIRHAGHALKHNTTERDLQ